MQLQKQLSDEQNVPVLRQSHLVTSEDLMGKVSPDIETVIRDKQLQINTKFGETVALDKDIEKLKSIARVAGTSAFTTGAISIVAFFMQNSGIATSEAVLSITCISTMLFYKHLEGKKLNDKNTIVEKMLNMKDDMFNVLAGNTCNNNLQVTNFQKNIEP